MNRMKKVANEKRFVKTKNGMEDLWEGGKPMTFEEWNKKCTEANTLDLYLKEKKEKTEKRED